MKVIIENTERIKCSLRHLAKISSPPPGFDPNRHN
jgi:hypothetical protein